MRLCAAQTRPITGNIQRNIEAHKKLIALAASHEADIIVFPELSLTGYEPKLAQELATHQEDSRFDAFQHLSDTEQIIIGVGVPTKHEAQVCISTILFQPHKPRHTYSKKYLHADEEAYFISGHRTTGFIGSDPPIALAICYEISVPEHAQNAHANGATMYMASVAKFARGIDQAHQRLAEIARMYSMTVFMANCIGPSDGQECAGKTALWNTKGALIEQLNDTDEGVILFDTNTQESFVRSIAL